MSTITIDPSNTESNAPHTDIDDDTKAIALLKPIRPPRAWATRPRPRRWPSLSPCGA